MRAALALAFACGCSGSGAVVFGVTSDFASRSGLDRLDVEIHAGDRFDAPSLALGPDKGQSDFPLELAGAETTAGRAVSIVVQGFLGQDLVVERRADTAAAPGTSLLHLNLDASCRFGTPTQFGIQPCGAGLTCIAGQCGDPFVPPDELPPYDPSWKAAYLVDACKPAGAGAPELDIGLGPGEYHPASDGAVAQVATAGQPAFHVWIALRTKNLRQRGTVLTLTGQLPELGASVPPLNVSFELLPDGAYCQQIVRFVLTSGNPGAVQPMLGKELDVTAAATDRDGAHATAARRFTLSHDVSSATF